MTDLYNGLTPRSRAHFDRRQREGLDAWLARLDEREARHAITPHYIYRAFDEFGLLLYIGCTLDVQSRMSGHADKPWRPYMSELVVSEPYPGKAVAREAEKNAIDTEGAFFNSTRADINATLANLYAAKRHLGWLGIYPPQHDIEVDIAGDFAETKEWLDHCDEDRAYHSLVDELRVELKASDYPYLTDRDRLNNYLAAREARAAA